MELFLNILWLLVALGILGAWRMRWTRHGRGTRHHPIAEWTAVGSALVLLFFAISLSDDLHQDVVLFSESSTSRRHSVVRVSGSDGAGGSGIVAQHGGQLGWAVLPRLDPSPSLNLTAHVKPSLDSSIFLDEFRQFSGRAPPASSL